MFAYTDPAGALKPAAALANYRRLLHEQYRQHARLAGSAFTLLEAFAEVAAAKQRIDSVRWIAFPKTAQASNAEIDADRLEFQDEYVEWRVERDAAGAVSKVTFTTEFPEYYEALAMANHTALVNGIKAVIPGAAPTAAELYGPGFTPAGAAPEARARKFREFFRKNPWNDGRKGILCLAQTFNTLGALFNLCGPSAVPKPTIPVGSVCATLGNFCGPARNSDPSIAAAIQTLARAQRGISFADPVGIVLENLGGIWRIGGTADRHQRSGGERRRLDDHPQRPARRADRRAGSPSRRQPDRERRPGGGGPERGGARRLRGRGRHAGLVAHRPGAIAAAERGRQRGGAGMRRATSFAAVVLLVMMAGAVTHAQLRKQAKEDGPVTALTPAERAELGDPLFSLVLKTAPLRDGARRHRAEADGRQRRAAAVRRPRAGARSGAPRIASRRAHVSRRERHVQQLQPNVALSLFFSDTSFGGRNIEAWGWDDRNSRYNYYKLDQQQGETAPTWKFRGSSVGADAHVRRRPRPDVPALPHQRRPGHEGAAAAVEQLALVQVAAAYLDGVGTDDWPVAGSPRFQSLTGAESLEVDVILPSIRQFNGRRVKALVQGAAGRREPGHRRQALLGRCS